MSTENVDTYIAVVVQSGYASFYEATALMSVEEVFDCFEIALVSNENEKRALKASQRKSKTRPGGRL